MIGFGILGCGRIGQVHARAISANPDAAVRAVVDPMPDAANALADKTGAVAMSMEDVFADPSVDAVIIGTPTDTHFDLIHKAAAAGKAIFCEKPVDLASDRIRTCAAAVDAVNVPFMTAFNRRFDPSFAHLQGRITAGDIGDVELVTILSRDPAPPPLSYIASSGGLFRDMMIHDFDMARFLLGEDPITVYASGACLVDPDIGAAGDIDTAAVTLTTKSGKLCQISNSRRATYGYDQRIEVHGSMGMLRAENQKEHSVELATQAGFATAPAQHFFLERYEAAYACEVAHFVACLKNQTPVTPGIQDGLAAQVLADAAQQSLETGSVITL
ncbi:MAG: inositol 2-dehydrogenase [Pseudomonadota bacterium]